jgi:hypothetical protein
MTPPYQRISASGLGEPVATVAPFFVTRLLTSVHVLPELSVMDVPEGIVVPSGDAPAVAFSTPFTWAPPSSAPPPPPPPQATSAAPLAPAIRYERNLRRDNCAWVTLAVSSEMLTWFALRLLTVMSRSCWIRM